MIKGLTLFITGMVLIFCTLILAENESRESINLPFDPRLCENTGIVERYFVIGKGGVVEHRYAPVLDCSVFDSVGEFVTFEEDLI